MRRADAFDMPETPRACVKCGTPYGLSRQSFRLGLRSVDLFACQACWNRYVAARRLVRLTIPLCAAAVAGGVALSLASGGLGPIVVGSFVGGLTLGAAVAYLWRCGPKRAPGPGIVVDVPGVGPVHVRD